MMSLRIIKYLQLIQQSRLKKTSLTATTSYFNQLDVSEHETMQKSSSQTDAFKWNNFL